MVENTSKVRDISGMRIGRFAIHERLGKGGMGEVFLAEDTTLGRPVVLKQIGCWVSDREHEHQRFLNEARITSLLCHPNIAGIYDVIDDAGALFLVMEYVEGVTLRKRLGQPMSIEGFYEWAIPCVEGLEAAHSLGIVHCDIKPENIILGPRGQPKILDFGLSKRLPLSLADVVSGSAESVSKRICGTPGYIAPEVLLEKRCDARVDIFSLGVVFYEALTGLNPFKADTFIVAGCRVLNAEPESLTKLNPQAPTQLSRVITKMLAKDPGHRYANATVLLHDLHASAPKKLHIETRIVGRLGVGQLWRKLVVAVALPIILLVLLALIPRARRGLQHLKETSESNLEQQIAVLPSTVTSDSEIIALGSGLVETLTARLGEMTTNSSLQVIPATLIRERRVATLQQAREEFGVNQALMINLQRVGNTLRVAYHLVDAKSGRQLRGGTVTASSSDLFALEDKVTDDLLEALRLGFNVNPSNSLQHHGTLYPDAFDFYLQGRGYLHDVQEPGHVNSAIELFNRALEHDPRYAQAFAGLGKAYWYQFEITKDPKWVRRAQAACERALALREQEIEGSTCMGLVSEGTGRFEQAVMYYQKAVTLEPANDEAVRGLASAYAGLGDIGQAERTYREAIGMRPNDWRGYSMLGAFYVQQGRYLEAVKMFSAVVALAPDAFRGYSNLGGTYVYLGRYSDAVDELERSISIRPTAYAYSNLATAYYNLRNFTEAGRLYREALKLDAGDYVVWGNLASCYFYAGVPSSQTADTYRKALSLAQARLRVSPHDAFILIDIAGYQVRLSQYEAADRSRRIALRQAPTDSDVLFNAATVSNLLGKPEEALELLKKALSLGFSPIIIRSAPDLDSLHSNPRFQALAGVRPDHD